MNEHGGYLSAMKENEIPFKKNWLKEMKADNTGKPVENAINELLVDPQPIDALLFSSNICGCRVEAYQFVRILKFRVNLP